MIRPINEYELHLYVDGHLDPARACDVEAYLAAHSAEAERVGAYRRQNELLRALGAAIDAELPPAGAGAWRGPGGRRTIIVWRTAVAAAALFGAAGLGAVGTALWRVPPPAPPPTPLGSFAEAGGHAIPAGSGGERLDTLLDHRLGAHLRLPDLSQRGFSLVSGRLVPSATGPAVQLLYRDKEGRQVTLLLAAAEAPPAGERSPLLFYSWSDGNISVAVGGGVDGDELRAIADAARRSLRPLPAPAPQDPPHPQGAAPT